MDGSERSKPARRIPIAHRDCFSQVCLAAAVAAGGCSDDDATTADTEATSGSSTTATSGAATTTSTSATTGSSGEETGEGPTVEVEVTLHPEQPMVVDVRLALSEAATEIELRHTFDDGVRISALDTSDALRPIYRLRGLSPATVHGIAYDISAATGTTSGEFDFTTEAPLLGFVPAFEVTGTADPADPPYRLIDLSDFPTVDNTGLFFVDTDGVTRWHYATTGLQPARPESIAGAAQLLPDGTIAFLHSLDFEIRDELNQRIVRYPYAHFDAAGLHHEVTVLPSGNFMVLAFIFETITYPEGDRYVTGDEIIEFTPDGDEVWRWNSFDHLDPQRTREGFAPTVLHPDTGALGFDWTHANGIEYDAESDELLVSLRHQDWIINVDHADGEVLWRLGDEGDFELLGDGGWFFHQHSPQWQPDGTLLLYDNDFGNPSVPLADSHSRAVRYALDFNAMTATVVYEDDAEQFAAPFAGDADRLPSGRYLVLDSSIQMPPGQGPLWSRLRELDEDVSPQLTWSLTTPLDTFSYRATAQPKLPGEP